VTAFGVGAMGLKALYDIKKDIGKKPPKKK
jgi:hypothetical protein